MTKDLTWIEISRENLSHNLNALGTRAGGIDRLCAVVKGNAYGHGLELTASLCYDLGVRKFAVYHVDEALRVRSVLGSEPLILLLGFADLPFIASLVEAKIDCLLLNIQRLGEIHQLIPVNEMLNIHLKIDTGMNRFGLQPHEIPDFLNQIKDFPRLKLTGAASHFANSWNIEDKSYAQRQYTRFERALDSLGEINGQLKYRHISNSGALMVHPNATLSFVRTGISIYGYYSNAMVKDAFDHELNLKPILSFKTRLVSIKQMEAGEYAGYDITFQASRKTKIALAPVGYSDGFPFAHSDKGAYVLLNGKRVPLIGRVNMNALLLDITDVTDAKLGDVVTLLGRDGELEISVWNWMSWGTPHLYESLTKLRSGVARYVT